MVLMRGTLSGLLAVVLTVDGAVVIVGWLG